MPDGDGAGRARAGRLALRRLAGLLIGLALLAASAWGLNAAGLGNALRQARPAFIALAVVATLLTLLAKAARWRVLCGVGVAFGPCSAGIVIGQLLNLLPGRPGDLARLAVLGREPTVGYALALGSLAAEKLLDSLMLLALIVGLLPLAPAGVEAKSAGVSIGLAAVALLGGLLVLRYAPARAALAGAARRWLGARVGRWIAAGLIRLGAARWTDWRAWAWSLCIWALAALTNQLIFWALGLALPASAALALLAALHLGRLVGVTPGQVGIFHYLCILVLGAYGTERATAFAVGVILHLVVTGPPALWGVWALRRLDAYSADWLEAGQRWARRLKRGETDGHG